MPRDIEVRDKAAMLANQFEANLTVKRFYNALARSAEANIQRDRDDFEETLGDD